MNDITIRRRVIWEHAELTHAGRVRANNEDAILSRPSIGLWAVADGMGGHEVGDVASQMIVAALEKLTFTDKLANMVDEVEDCLIDINQKIIAYSAQYLDAKTMGSTVVVLLISGKVGVCLWVGDSRLYRLRKGSLERISTDHSRVEELIQQGKLTPEEAEKHPESNVITRAVGVNLDFCVDICGFDTQVGDTFVLCSDGLYEMLNDKKIQTYLRQSDADRKTELVTKVDTLVEQALQQGAPDNISLILVQGVYEKGIPRERINN